MPAMTPLEIQALAKIIDELDYYQILHLEPASSASEVKKAFHATSRSFHPDANRHLEPALVGECARIAKRVTEAYCVLRDPRRRKAYDGRLTRKEGLRMQLAEAKAAHAREENAERQGKTAQGRQFHQKAEQDIRSENWASAAQNLQMALTFEPQNAYFQDQLADIKKLLKAKKKS